MFFAASAGIWELSVEKLLHMPLPWPLPHDLALKHALLTVVSGFAVQQLSGQLWRVFVTGVSGQVCCNSQIVAACRCHLSQTSQLIEKAAELTVWEHAASCMCAWLRADARGREGA